MDGPGASGFVRLDDGRAALYGAAAALCRWFDSRFLQMACETGATECRFPATIARETLARAGFLDAFPGGATALDAHASRGDYLLCPAVCYHAYASLSGRRIHQPVILTAAQSCFREGDRAAASPSRLWEFTMREVIFIGPADWVVARRDEWTPRIREFAARLGLRGSIEPASDPFFGPSARGRRLLQQVKGLKYELRLDLGADWVAAASFNLHEAFFGSRFDIDLADGIDAHSACVAFGLERWALAYIGQHGESAAGALANG